MPIDSVDLILQLDKIFQPSQFPPDTPFSRSLPRAYELQDINYKEYFFPDFLSFFNGLMINNSSLYNKVYLTVFLSEEILDKIFLENSHNTLIFTHHPVGMETSGRGFLPLREEYLKKLREREISVYAVHSPMDINPSYSPSLSIANQLRLEKQQMFDFDGEGYHGVAGELAQPTMFNELIGKLKILFDINQINYIQKNEVVKKIGIIAGGGADVAYIKEAIGLGCDVYLTGDYLNKINNEYSIQKRIEFESVSDQLDISMVECSHYATEKIVFLNEIKSLFDSIGLDNSFVEQDNPWY